MAEGARLFSLAADKFDNALDLEPQNGQAMRLAGQSLLDAGLCTLGTLMLGPRTMGHDSRRHLPPARPPALCLLSPACAAAYLS